jgi:transcriptional regulator with XRE-family HTH domain
MTTEPEQLRALVGARIRALRRMRGMSAQELADALRWPLDTLVNYEYGRRPLQLDRLAALATALAVPPAALLIADTLTADLVARLAADASLAQEVRFFLDALQAEAGQPHQQLDSDGHPPHQG